MASSAINILSGIAAAAAGLSGEKASKSGAVAGLDLGTIIPALIGGKTGGAGGAIGSVVSSLGGKSGGGSAAGTLASAALKGALSKTKLGSLADSVLSVGKKTTTAKTTDKSGLGGLAALILGNSGSGVDIASIVKLAVSLAGTVKTKKDLTGLASSLGKKLSSLGGISLPGGASTVKALDKVLEKDTKTDLFKSILKGLI